MTTIFTSIAVITSTYIASPTVTPVEAFHLSSTTTATLPLSLLHPHRNNRSQELLLRSPATPLLSEKVAMSATSLKGTGTTSEDDHATSLSLSSSSVSDVLISKIGSTTSTVVAGTFFIVLCYKRDALMVSFFLGAICNAIFGKVLKKFLKIERPEIAVAVAVTDGDENSERIDAVVAPDIDTIDRPSDNGMPSSHAMSLGFICTFVALLLPKTTIPLLAYAAISLIYRVRVNLHTVDQIAVGAVLGTFDGAVWWQLCTTNGFHGFNIVELVSSSGMMNDYGLLSWYLLAVPALIGAAVVGSVERRLGKYFRSSSSSDETMNSKQE
jgi:membrane-associated phospholipid phosphatase